MDFPTLIYVLALAAYSLFTWWKKNKKPGKNAQNPPQGETKAEVPEWMKEIFGDVSEESTPETPQTRPQMTQSSAEPPVRRAPLGDDRRQLDPSRSEPMLSQPISGGPAVADDHRSMDNMYLMEQKKRASLAKKPILTSSRDASAYEIGNTTEDLINADTEDWRRAIILAEVLKPYQA
jgi:hypothetical protein